MSSLSTSLKNSFDRWLNPYENYLRQAKPGVYQQLEYEYGGPLTPSPAPSPIKRSTVNTPSSLRGESPARHATDALQASLTVPKLDGDREIAMSTDLPSSTPQPTTGGFTAINSGGFTAVNAGFTSVNRPTPPEAKSFTPPPKRHDSPASLTKDVLDFRPSGLGPATALKRQLSFDSIDSARKEASADRDDLEGGSRRSKRLKKGKLVHQHATFVAVSPILSQLYLHVVPIEEWLFRQPVLPRYVPLFRSFHMQCCMTTGQTRICHTCVMPWKSILRDQ